MGKKHERRKKLLGSTEDLEWAGRRMMEFRTVVLLVNWMEEEGLVDPARCPLDPVEVAMKFTGGPPRRARGIFNDAAQSALNGLLKR